MSGEFEAAGAMATAGLVAGAIEGREGTETGHGPCLNCGAALTGRYCANCGQAAHPHRTLSHVFEEFLHGVLHFDTRAWRTLPMVIGRPGTLTRNYIYGKRARYISPLALFLFCVFFMFFVFAFVDMPIGSVSATAEQRVDTVENLREARAHLVEAQAELTQAQQASEGEPAGLEAGLARQAVARAQADVARRELEVGRIDRQLAGETIAPNDDAPAAESAPPAEAARAEGHAASTWQERLQEEARGDGLQVNTGSRLLNERIRHAFENPDLTLYKIQNAAYKYSFLLVPISLPFIAFLFLWKRGLTLYDHVVYALYALAFASLLFVTVMVLLQSSWTAWAPGWLVGIGLPTHTFFHLKGAYALGWWSALWRTLFMLTFAFFSLMFFMMAIVMLGLTG